MRSAPGFQLMIVPSRVLPMIASSDESTIAARYFGDHGDSARTVSRASTSIQAKVSKTGAGTERHSVGGRASRPLAFLEEAAVALVTDQRSPGVLSGRECVEVEPCPARRPIDVRAGRHELSREIDLRIADVRPRSHSAPADVEGDGDRDGRSRLAGATAAEQRIRKVGVVTHRDVAHPQARRAFVKVYVYGILGRADGPEQTVRKTGVVVVDLCSGGQRPPIDVESDEGEGPFVHATVGPPRRH